MPHIQKRGGALFGDRRFGHVFVRHNGARSFYLQWSRVSRFSSAFRRFKAWSIASRLGRRSGGISNPASAA